MISANRKISSTKTMYTGVTDSPQILEERRYIVGRTIGEGAFSKVKVALKIQNGYAKRIVCKEINKAQMSRLGLYKFLPREISIIRTLVHPHIIKVCDTKDIQGRIYVFMELCEGGDPLEFIQKRGPLMDCKARHLFR
jgi:serine/threonine protein kinase